MKHTLLLLSLITVLFSCKKESNIQNIYGLYIIGTDSMVVTRGNADYIQLKWLTHSGVTATFDSVVIYKDLSIMDGEIVWCDGIGWAKATGVGNFSNNMILFHFNIDNKQIVDYFGFKH